MFTGIIMETGIVRSLAKGAEAHRLEVESKEVVKRVSIGSSVAVNGVCLTVVAKGSGVLSFDVMEETLGRSNLMSLKKNSPVNLEGALRADGVLGGHFVLGHIDCVGKITGIRKTGEALSMEVYIPEKHSNLVVEKGSVAMDGVSLTVGDVKDNTFKVHLIPHTLGATTLGLKRPSDAVNIEFDIIGKYMARFEEVKGDMRITERFLKDKGF